MWNDNERQTKTFFGISWTKHSLRLNTNSEAIAAIDRGAGQLFQGVGDVFGFARDFIRYKRASFRLDYARQLEYQARQARLVQSAREVPTFEARPQDYVEHSGGWDTNEPNSDPNWSSPAPMIQEPVFTPDRWIPTIPTRYQ